MRRATVGEVEAILEEDWQAAGFNVWLREGGRYGRILVPGRGAGYTIREDLEPERADRPGPSLFLPEEALEAIAAAAAGVAPAVPAHVDALADARAQRDRLLALLELERIANVADRGLAGPDGAIAELERLRKLR